MEHYINPDHDTYMRFSDLARNRPIHMLNLIRLRDRALYDDGREATGAEAYAIYGRESAPIFQGVGGRIVWRATPRLTLIGPEDESWHIAFVAEYPTAQAFLNMIRDPDYQMAVMHRTAAVADSRLIRTDPLARTDTIFG